MSRDDAHRFLIAYDVADDRRRDRLAKCLLRHGDRVQYSVFVVDVSAARMLRLQHEIAGLIVAVEDSVIYCDLGVARSVDVARYRVVGRSRHVTGSGPIII
ncbi:CRISPR-associated endonuclease Cas2 [Nocardia camponoti]|uniref:CRISPR-associated endonuclease Cas2 n=1 Tax=Nocardia camponoti TaxID=1616106 RepID=UPI001662F0A9|nr:CRISPR-associated endonuclease Cas2 [Nocardia camponoti]